MCSIHRIQIHSDESMAGGLADFDPFLLDDSLDLEEKQPVCGLRVGNTDSNLNFNRDHL